MTDDYLRISKHQGNSHLENLVLQDADGIALSDYIYTVAGTKGRKASIQTLQSAMPAQKEWFVPLSGVTASLYDVVGEQRTRWSYNDYRRQHF
jgi:hypothetical protein